MPKKLVRCSACVYHARKLWQVGSVRVCKKCKNRIEGNNPGVRLRRAR